MANFPADFNDYMFYTDVDWRAYDGGEARLWGDWFLNGQPISTSVDSTIINVKDFGAIGDGVANDLISIQNAVSAGAGKTVYFPAGTYKIVPSGPGAILNVMTGTTLLGVGIDSIINLAPTTNDYRQGIYIGGNNVTFNHLTINRATDFFCAMLQFKSDGGLSNISFFDCIFDGKLDLFVAEPHCICLPVSGTLSHVRIERCTIRNFVYGWLQTNAATTVVNDVKVVGCTFENHRGDALGFNSPSGTNKDILVDGCRFFSNVGMFGVSLAKVENARVVNNYFEVTAHEAVHIEDYSCYIVVANNTCHECSVTGGFGSIHIIDSHHIVVDSNTVRNTTAMNQNSAVSCIGAESGTTASGQPALGATYSITFSNNVILSGPNNGILAYNFPQLAVTGNIVTGGLSINSSFVESGANDKIGVYVPVNQNFGARVTDNTIKGFRFGIASSISLESNAFQPGTVISGNSISQCRYGLMGNNCLSVAVTGNHINRCAWPLVMGPSGAGAYGAGMFPYSIVGNVFYGNQFPASYGGKLVVVSKGSVTTGSGKTLTTEPLPIECYPSYLVTFTGGGVFTPDAYAPAGATSIVGTLATANIAANEVGYKTGIIDRPNGAPYTETNRSVGLNADSVAGTYT